MDRDDAVSYLHRKNQIEGITKYSKQEESKINEVIKKGKIYGDPVAEIEC